MSVVAEGIELEEQLVRVRDSGCGFGQGYYFSRPVSALTVEALIGAKLPL